MVSYSGRTPAHSYTQVYRTGIIEAVEGSILAGYEGKKFIPSVLFERAIANYLPACFRILKELGCPTPVVIALTLTNARGLFMSDDLEGYLGGGGHPIDIDTLILPETVVEDTGVSVVQILKPTFDLIWNTCGYTASKNFDADGNWVGKIVKK